MPMCGSTGSVKPVDDECRDVLGRVREGCEEKAGKKFEYFEPIHYKTQLVNGINFFIKVKIADNDYLHVRAHKSFQDEVTLWGIQQSKILEEEVHYFD
ncbi:cystatin-B-like [Varroa jacobsoni]|uniref:Cystatin domain-containing protein n=1 Tax=Varroa destructor TaxID=109461 RepID=A0A7M7J1P8_VARDE|nr:cystatin-B-like [Varroa destructor]XP_022696609.1 cystatin-B-like [Varroa jacobsoni]